MERLLFIFSLFVMLIFGQSKMFFHQDDFVYLSQATKTTTEMLAPKSAEHLNYVFRLVMQAEWKMYGLNYPIYILTSLLMHSLVLYLLFKFVSKVTSNKEYGIIAAILFSINTNWNEVLLWVSGQVFMVNLILISLSYLVILKKSHKIMDYFVYSILTLLSILTSGLGVWVPITVLLALGIDYKRKKINKIGWINILILSITHLLYRSLSTYTGSLGIREFDFNYLFDFGYFYFMSIGNTVIGRLFVPWDNARTLRLIPIIIITFLVWKHRMKIVKLFNDVWFRLISLSFLVYYFLITLGRMQYGIGNSRAERYAYFGLFFGLILVFKIISEFKIDIKKMYIATCVIVLIQIFGFIDRTNKYIDRPAKNKEMIRYLINLDTTHCYKDDYLPNYVFEQDILKYSDISLMIGEDLRFENSENCSDVGL